jgi:hypothetical protein
MINKKNTKLIKTTTNELEHATELFEKLVNNNILSDC